jgi:hypothetical protein
MEPLITRDEIERYLFSVYDMAEDVSVIRQLLQEEDGGQEEEAE